MPEETSDRLPEIKEIVGALVFGADRPLTVAEIRRCLAEMAETELPAARAFREVSKEHVEEALSELCRQMEAARFGFRLAEIGGGYRLQSDPICAPWLKHLLKMERPQRLSRPALETLAIVAYRQPVTKAEVEGIRGVAVDHILKALMELQLLRIAGRSELPGRPFLYGTTQMFLEHFRLRSLDDLKDLDPMLAPRAPARAAPTSAAPAAPEPVFENEAAVPPAPAPEPGDEPPAGDRPEGA
jgi:segregation and condensation protein B